MKRPGESPPGLFLCRYAGKVEADLEDWRAKALELFPEWEEMIGEEQNPIALWIDLFNQFDEAYRIEPINDDLVGRIYGYAAWRLEQPSTESAETDPSSAAAVGLIESIPLNKRASADLYRWLTLEAFEGFETCFAIIYRTTSTGNLRMNL